MRTVVQRVRQASVRVDDRIVGSIGRGAVLLVGVERDDTQADAQATVRKIAALRMFEGRTPMDRTLAQVEGACLVVSQFTLAAVLAKGNRPGLARAAEPARAEGLYEQVAAGLAATGLQVETGRFGAAMIVELQNEGPVTLMVETQGGRIVDRHPEAS